ncbi:MAG: hypothetical protein JXR48_07495 [Candidatus Delongbacteria bacterium]|nr:hypothetical protein [Candidatus Delongbacteria bacterium]MBN2834795.1 hypothetical protein [Candidatus Delongbacteria bacterium]
MEIANPIYDVVFKYLMEDNKIAKLLLSAIIGEEIIELEFRPQEYTLAVERNGIKEFAPKFTVYRIDFNAKIKNSDGTEKLIILELQKARLSTDIMRFRRYLGSQYLNKNNVFIENEIKKPLPILTIYFLGEGLETLKGFPVVHVKKNYIDKSNDTIIEKKDDFVESLVHDSYIISIPDLSYKRRNELETVLSIFDQSERDESHHILNVREDDFPEKYRAIIRRLQKAKETKEIRDTMDVEDDYIEELYEKEKALENLRKSVDEKNKALYEKDKALEEAKKGMEEKDRLIAELMRKVKDD